MYILSSLKCRREAFYFLGISFIEKIFHLLNPYSFLPMVDLRSPLHILLYIIAFRARSYNFLKHSRIWSSFLLLFTMPSKNNILYISKERTILLLSFFIESKPIFFRILEALSKANIIIWVAPYFLCNKDWVLFLNN